MRPTQTNRRAGFVFFLTAFLLLAGISSAQAQEAQPGAGKPAPTTTQAKPEPKPSFEILWLRDARHRPRL